MMTDSPQASAASDLTIGPRAMILPAREVPLGGVRSMNVWRALPQRALPTVGAWCFLDRFGPQRTTMRVEPHPHMGLQTVTWPLFGEVRHRDSLGSDVILSVGQLNLMTSGAGIAHSEYSLGDDAVLLDALQLWVALPQSARWTARGFERHQTLPTVALPAVIGADAQATVIMGTLAGVTSPATTHSPLVGAQFRIGAGSRVRIPLEVAWEHAVVVLDGDLTVLGSELPGEEPLHPAHNDLAYLGTGRGFVDVSSEQGAFAFLLGGEPLEEELVMWWNFVGRSHEEIVEAREDWEAHSARFGSVGDHGDVRIPAPPMPHVRLTPRTRRL